ncbi:MAG: ATP synthase F1 subunit delta [Bacteroidales bacterium]|nr:ATP synthase F1 subunit delta [Bacteroidales bacterium]MDD2424942.1 ATP synthase F1 subunit delta [Bacteroidales bacterium]MDD3989094.1 ATP synthase F1 subunit delta [Bacteroidales bacterium]MDD4638477.1 ATP synthase F1 subunit delta [Bacteroidales bacterium]
MYKLNIPTRYARALHLHASSGAGEEDVYISVNTLIQSFESFPEIVHILTNPAIETKIKREILVTASGSHITKELSDFIDLILKNGREPEIPRIMMSYADLYRKTHNINKCRLTTAIETDAATDNGVVSFVKKISGGEVEIEKRTDPSIIGGFILEIGNRVLDASISGRLKEIRRELSETK